MTDIEPEEDLPPVAHVILVYNGPVAPHWEMKVRYGDQKMLDEFWTRVNARLLLLPKHDPQFRRNRERVNRDAERELIICDWDLGEDDAETTTTPTTMPAPAQESPEQPPAETTAPEADVDAVATEQVEGDAEAPGVSEAPEVSEAAEAVESLENTESLEGAEAPAGQG